MLLYRFYCLSLILITTSSCRLRLSISFCSCFCFSFDDSAPIGRTVSLLLCVWYHRDAISVFFYLWRFFWQMIGSRSASSSHWVGLCLLVSRGQAPVGLKRVIQSAGLRGLKCWHNLGSRLACAYCLPATYRCLRGPLKLNWSGFFLWCPSMDAHLTHFLCLLSTSTDF